MILEIPDAPGVFYQSSPPGVLYQSRFIPLADLESSFSRRALRVRVPCDCSPPCGCNIYFYPDKLVAAGPSLYDITYPHGSFRAVELPSDPSYAITPSGDVFRIAYPPLSRTAPKRGVRQIQPHVIDGENHFLLIRQSSSNYVPVTELYLDAFPRDHPVNNPPLDASFYRVTRGEPRQIAKHDRIMALLDHPGYVMDTRNSVYSVTHIDILDPVHPRRVVGLDPVVPRRVKSIPGGICYPLPGPTHYRFWTPAELMTGKKANFYGLESVYPPYTP